MSETVFWWRFCTLIAATIIVVVIAANVLDKKPTFAEQATVACHPNTPIYVDAKARKFECSLPGVTR